METLLLHRSLLDSEFFAKLCSQLKEANVSLYSGPRLAQKLTFGPPAAKSLRIEYGGLALTIEV